METTNNYTQIPNELLEALTSGVFTPAAVQILLLIARKTYGYHKSHDQISLSQFSKTLNMDRRTVMREIKRLQLVSLVSLVQKGNSRRASNDWTIDLSGLMSKLGAYKPLVHLVVPTPLDKPSTRGILVPELGACTPHTKEILQKKEEKERENPTNSIDWLEYIPFKDMTELSKEFSLQASTIRDQGLFAASYLKSQGRTAKDYKEYLKTWIRRDQEKLLEKEGPLVPREERIPWRNKTELYDAIPHLTIPDVEAFVQDNVDLIADMNDTEKILFLERLRGQVEFSKKVKNGDVEFVIDDTGKSGFVEKEVNAHAAHVPST